MTLRGAAAMNAALESAQRAPLDGVSSLEWVRFVHALTVDDDDGPNKGNTRPFNARTHAGGFGCFGMLPRRLVDLGIAENLRIVDGKAIAVSFVEGARAFLADPFAQRNALDESMRRYDGEIAKITLPPDMSRSGALALYHRLGPAALSKWQQHKQPSTLALFQRANGLF